jgi:hypothetical protein
MKGHFIERKSNKLENYYRQTDPNQIKKIYKTITRIFGYLNQKMKKWTLKHGKNFNPNNLTAPMGENLLILIKYDV